jgi:membrane fusion protein (multidrug efflux system)
MAERDLAFTIIRAPFDGAIGNRAVQKGDFLQPSQRLASLVQLDHVYIDANFKETQLARLRPDQTVKIEVDALPSHVFEGHVVSLAPASGSVFSLLPAENATGNFTKVVQRVPVRIRVDQHADEQGLLRPGMSTYVSVNTIGEAEKPLAAQAQTHAAPR